ncbi:site-specific integrase [Dyadobacter psychrotolerans]|uniref:Site-specific integrase n=1 Tax=Dyadobacter psychrotolerans TaxID=2541721 RepID=A0A4R5DPJ1_9BACT|nr:site-specific integrase [Dyadobacter psychrotolerans]TDE16169.1 site-specific integrase [Dyadobacter psychrotolerans]
MLAKNFTLLFYLKKRSNYVSGKLPVYMRISVNGSRSEMSMGRDCEPEKWNNISCRRTGTKSDTKEFNAYLDTVQSKVYQVYRSLLETGAELNVENVRNVLIGVSVRPKMTLEIFEEHNQKLNQLIGKGFAKSTLTKYKTCYDHTSEFIRCKYEKNDLDIQKLNYEFISEFEFWLKSQKSCGHNTVMKYLTNFKKIVMICVKNGWLTQDPFASYRMSRQVVKRSALTEAELSKVNGKDFENERLNQVRDIFVFSCFTGLAYIDVYNLSRQQIIEGINGEMWLVVNRQKTDSESRVPLLPIALEILEKYEDHPQCIASGRLLPVLSNQKLNSYLKEIADVCRFDKTLTFHLARHTFATTVTLTNGVPIESVSKMLGHSSIKTTQIYAKIVDRKISEDMSILRKKFV